MRLRGSKFLPAGFSAFSDHTQIDPCHHPAFACDLAGNGFGFGYDDGDGAGAAGNHAHWRLLFACDGVAGATINLLTRIEVHGQRS